MTGKLEAKDDPACLFIGGSSLEAAAAGLPRFLLHPNAHCSGLIARAGRGGNWGHNGEAG